MNIIKLNDGTNFEIINIGLNQFSLIDSSNIIDKLTIDNLSEYTLQNENGDIMNTFKNKKVLKYSIKDDITTVDIVDADYEEPAIDDIEAPVLTLDELKESKIYEMNATQQKLIENGVDIVLSDGTTEHFDLTANDQISLMGLQTKVIAGDEMIPWHTSDDTEHCKFYSNADMQIITNTALVFVSYNVTYFRDLRIYINSLNSEDEVNAIVYGMPIPEQFQSEPLKAMLAQMNA